MYFLKIIHCLLVFALLSAGAFAAPYGSDDFVSTWKTTTNDESITIPTIGDGYNYNVDCDYDGSNINYELTNQTETSQCTYSTPGTYMVVISAAFPRIYIDEHLTNRLKIRTIEQWGTGWTSMEGAFAGAAFLVNHAQDTPIFTADATPSFLGIFYRAGKIGGPDDTGNWEDWDTSKVVNMERAFGLTYIFNKNISDWDTAKVTNMGSMFSGARLFNQDIGDWDTAKVTDMSGMFSDAEAFNQDIGGWDTAAVTDMDFMFSTADVFNQDIGQWNTGAVTNMESMFYRAKAFNQALDWNTGAVTIMTHMFWQAFAFNGDINGWNTGAVQYMSGVFREASAFNQDIGGWNTSAVTSMLNMFLQAYSFNGDISGWNTSAVTHMGGMFRDASSFNQDIGGWNTGAVIAINQMFWQADAFNQDLSEWDTGAVTTMKDMFYGADTFNQSLANFDMSKINTNFGDMLSYSALSTANYDATLQGWATQELPDNLTFKANNLTYSDLGKSARKQIINEHGWHISGDSFANTPPVINFGAEILIDENNDTIILSASDIDSEQEFDFAITAGVDASLFTISTDNNNGILRFNSPPDYENPIDNGDNNSYEISITVTDNGSPPLSSTQAITILVQNLTQGIFITSADYFEVAENSLSVGTLSAFNEAPTPIQFALSADNTDEAFFNLSSDGALNFNQPPNFEIPNSADGDNYHINITVSDAVLSVQQTLTIEIIDINDAPVFTSTDTFVIDEAQTFVGLITTTDEDVGQSVILANVLTGADKDLFILNSAGELHFSAAPDFDAPENTLYSVVVSAEDNNNPPLHTMQTITISVVDVNEGVPFFTSAATLTVAENSKMIGIISAEDIDSKQNIGFSLLDNTADNDLFIITPNGALSFKQAADFEFPFYGGTNNTYTLAVEITDNYQPPKTNQQTFTINVIDVDEGVFITTNDTFSILENQTTVATLSAIDEANQQIAPFLTTLSGADASLFKLTSTGFLRFNNAPDFETPADHDSDGIYEITATATNGVLNANQNITITPINVNEAPVLLSKTTLNLAENIDFVVQLSAFDADAGQVVSFSLNDISPADNDFFQISADGALRFQTAPDFETPADTDTENVYLCNLIISDGQGDDIGYTIIVTITDINEAPVINLSKNVMLDENTTEVASLSVSDYDSGQTAIFSGLLGEDATLFTFTNGVLSFKQAPNYEKPIDNGKDNTYTVIVVATDDFQPPLISSQTMQIVVQNVEESPIFTSAADWTVAENTTLIASITATDEDFGQTPTISSILTGADALLFNFVAGKLSFNAPPDFETPLDNGNNNIYNITISADSAGETISLPLSINLNDITEPPNLSSDNNNYIFAAGEMITPIHIDSTKTDFLDSCSLNPNINGLEIALSADFRACVISGTPTAVTAADDYIVIATNSSGADNFSLNIVVEAKWVIVNNNPFANNGTVNSTMLRFDAGNGEQFWLLGGANNTDTSAHSNNVWVSDDGINWSLKTQVQAFAAITHHSSVVFNGRMWIFAGSNINDSNAIYSSADGVNWTQHTSYSKWNQRYGHSSFVFANKIWLIGGITNNSNYMADVWSSNDGINWTKTTDDYNGSMANQAFQAGVVFNGKMWIIGGYPDSSNANVWSSEDGINWTQVAINPSAWSNRNAAKALVYDGKIWVIGGNNKTDVWSSADGVNWAQESGFADIVAAPNALVVDDAIIVASAADNSGNAINKIYIYQDSATSPPNLPDNNPPQTLTFDFAIINPIQINSIGGGLLTECSISPALPTGLMINVSSDGNGCIIEGIAKVITAAADYTITATNALGFDSTILSLSTQAQWDIANHNAYQTPRLSNRALSFNNQAYLLGGTNADSSFLRTNALLKSTNGINDWIQIDSTFNAVDIHSSVVYDGKMWVLGGRRSDATPSPEIFKSNADGTLWSEVVSDFPARMAHSGVVFNNQIRIIGGIKSDGSKFNDMLSSADGISWISTTNNLLERVHHSSVVFDGKLWVMGGENASGDLTNDVLYSTNATDWQKISTNIDWSPRYRTALVVYRGKMYLIGGNSGGENSLKEVWSSANGTDWQREPDLPTHLETVRAIAYNNKILVLSGVNRTLDAPFFYQKALNKVYTYSAPDVSVPPLVMATTTVSLNAQAALTNQVILSKISGDKISFCLSHPPLPDSLILSVSADGQACVLSGTTPAFVSSNTYTITVSNAIDSTTAILTLNIKPTWKILNDNPFVSARQNNSLLRFDDGNGEKLWLLGGATDSTGANISNIVLQSNDGAIWNEVVQSDTFVAIRRHTSVVFNGAMWILGGTKSNGDDSNQVFSSTNGTSWTLHNEPNWSARYNHSTLVYDEKIWVIGGRTASGRLNDVWWSADGETWTQATSNAEWSDRDLHTTLVFAGKMWLMGGIDGITYLSNVYSSTDGITWELSGNTSAIWTNLSMGVVYDDKMWLMGGKNISSFYISSVFSSTDGTNWSAESNLPDSVGHIRAVVFNNHIIVASSATDVVNNKIYIYKSVSTTPVFTSATEFSHEENQTTVANLTTDLGQTVDFSIFGGSDSDLFAITAGVLRFVTPPDFEKPQDSNKDGIYTVIVAAADTQIPLAQGTQTINITVIGVNETPIITLDEDISVAENTLMISLTATDDAGQSVQWTMSGEDIGFFTLTADGALYFNTPPDFEATSENNIYTLLITATDSLDPSLSVSQNLNISITDSNEAPFFTSSPIFSAEENQTWVGVISAKDTDIGQTAVLLSILGGEDKDLFRLDDGALYFVDMPDYEAGKTHYTVIASISDNQIPPLISKQTITISLVDVNEFAPIFTSATNFSVIENNRKVGIISATDADGAQTVEFFLQGIDADFFNLSLNGELRFKAPPDYENPAGSGGNTYFISISAQDNHFLPMSAEQTFTISVKDVSEGLFVTSSDTFSPAENQTTVGNLTAIDEGGGQPLLFSFELSGEDKDLFTLLSGGVLRFDESPNFEQPTDSDKDGIYTIIVTANSGVSSVLNIAKTLTIIVQDVNDAPVFTSTHTFKIEENTQLSALITATDEDAGQNLTFSLNNSNDNSAFNLSATGDLSFATLPDFEKPADIGKINIYTLEVVVSDDNFVSESATQIINISVIDINEAPLITSTNTFEIEENSTIIGHLTATDEDAGQTPTFSILSGENALLFELSADNTLSFIAQPNYEIADNYTLVISANDNQTPPLSATQTINITVLDINDTPTISGNPITLADLGTAYSFAFIVDDEDADLLAKNISALPDGLSFDNSSNIISGTPTVTGSFTITLTVSDGSLSADFSFMLTVEALNLAPIISKTTYEINENQTDIELVVNEVGASLTIIGGDDEDKFSLSGYTLRFTPSQIPDYENPDSSNNSNIYNVIIKATDAQMTSLSTTQTVTISVIDINEAPTISTAADSFVVAENTLLVATLTATDIDAGQTATFLSVLGGADAGSFIINNAGTLSFINKPDFESGKHNYTVIISATDNQIPPLIAEKILTISITDSNESPFFASVTTTIIHPENQINIATIAAIDVDIGQNISYEISGGADKDLFTLSGSVLSFITPPNYENGGNNYTVAVRATDDYTPPLSATQTITVQVEDINEAPVFAATDTFFIDENQTQIGTIKAADEDENILTFIINGGADADLFTLSESGVLSFDAAPNFENPQGDYSNDSNNYNIIISVSDNQTPALTTQKTFIIVVENVADAPFFTLAETNINLIENAADGVRYQVQITDINNLGTIGYFSLSLSGDDIFSVDPAPLISFVHNDIVPSHISDTDATLYFSLKADTTGTASIIINLHKNAHDFTRKTITVEAISTNNAPIITAEFDSNLNNISVYGGHLYGSFAEGSYADIKDDFAQNGALIRIDSRDEFEFAFNQVNSSPAGSPFIGLTNSGGEQGIWNYDGEQIATGLTGITYFPGYYVRFAADNNNPNNKACISLSPDFFSVDCHINNNSAQGGIFEFANGFPALDNVAFSLYQQATETILITISAYDLDGDNLNWSVNSTDGTATLSTTEAGDSVSTVDVGFAPYPDFIGKTTLTITLTDASGDSSDLQIEVMVNPITIITSEAAFALAENTTTISTLTVVPVAAEFLTTLNGEDANLFNLSAEGILSFKAIPDFETQIDENADGIYMLSVSATDGATTATQAISITVTNINETPVISGFPAEGIKNVYYSFAPIVVDEDADSVLTYTIMGTLPAGLSFAPQTGIISGIPTTAGNFTAISISVSDSTFTTSLTFDLVIAEENFAPQITQTTYQAAENQTDIQLQVNEASALLSIIDGADMDKFIIDGHTLRFKQVPNFEMPNGSDGNIYTLKLKATDAQDITLSSMQILTIIVEDIADSPLFTLAETNINLIENATNSIRYQVQISAIADVDGEGSFAISSSGEAIFSIDPSPLISFVDNDIVPTHATQTTAILYFSIRADTAGVAAINITLTDSEQDSSSQTITVSVATATTSPVITPQFDSTLQNISVFGGSLYASLATGSYADIYNAFEPHGALLRIDSRDEFEFAFNQVNSSPGGSPFIGLTNSGGGQGIWNYDGEQIATGLVDITYFPGYYVRFVADNNNPNNKTCISLSPDFFSVDCHINNNSAQGGIFEFANGFPALDGVFSLPEKTTKTLIATVSGYDLDGDNLTWSVISADGTATLDITNLGTSASTAEVHFVPHFNFSGQALININLADATGGSSNLEIRLSVEAPVPALNLDIDDDGKVFPADGILILRYMLLAQNAISVDTTDVLADGAKRNGEAIFSYLNANKASLDIDADGNIEAATDGVLIMRFILNPAAAVIDTSNALGDNSQRTDAQILLYLQSLNLK